MKRFHFPFWLKWGLVALIFVFLGKMLWDNWNQVRGMSFTLRLVPFISGTILFALSYFILIWAWHCITLKLKIALSPSETIRVWLYSQLGKYLPGKIWLFLGRISSYACRGKSEKNTYVALYFEMATVTVASGLIFLISAYFFDEINLSELAGRFEWLVFALILLGFVFLHPRIFQVFLNWILVRLKRKPVLLSISYSDVLRILFIEGLAWMVGGIGFFFFVSSFVPVLPSQSLFFIGALAVSSILGMAALFAPSGLGVREGVLALLLSLIMPNAIAILLAVLTRLWMTLIEIGLIGVVYLTHWFQKAKRKRPLHG